MNMMWFLYNNITGIIVAFIIVFIYIKIKNKINFFSDKNLNYIKPTLKDQIRSLKFSSQFAVPNEFYKSYKNSDSPYIGAFLGLLSPNVIILDPSLVQDIVIKNFSHFHDHGMDLDVENNPLMGHLFLLNGDKWRTLRNKLLPTFTSGKLKAMVPTMEDCANNMIQQMKINNELNNGLDLKELFNSYTLSVIAISVFSIDPKSLQDPDCEFKRVMNRLLYPSALDMARLAFIMLFTSVSNFFKIKMFPKYAEDFFINLTKDSLELRKKSGVKRNDFIQLLLELKEKGSVEVDTKDLEEDEKEDLRKIQSETITTKIDFTNELLAAQVFVFLAAGYDNTSFLASITTYYLSKNPDIQKRVREEVREVSNKHGKIDYLALRDMKLLGACVDEALRLQPPAPGLLRKCNKTYTLPNGDKIEKDMMLLIPAKGFQNDSKYWSNPDQYNPDRFLDGENVQPGTYLPFGDGPRICIAQRLALIITKMVLTKIVLEYEIEPSSRTQEPLQLAVLKGTDIEGGLWAHFRHLVQ